ncbi:hypothetical protein GLYMA_01G192550v4 [Glycine max]|nr:hypothetical protein GLYMA_01G192550v4 [Glycine max]KAH1163886.1 hypothetical protein GYH30_002087 [Glycine max]
MKSGCGKQNYSKESKGVTRISPTFPFKFQQLILANTTNSKLLGVDAVSLLNKKISSGMRLQLLNGYVICLHARPPKPGPSNDFKVASSIPHSNSTGYIYFPISIIMITIGSTPPVSSRV